MMTEQRLEHEQAADDHQHELVLGRDRDAPSAPPSARLPVSPMKTAAGGALYQRKPRPAPTIAAQKRSDRRRRGRWGCRDSRRSRALPTRIGDDAEARRRR